MAFLLPVENAAVAPFSGPEPRRLAGRIVLAQIIVTMSIAGLSVLAWSVSHAASALAGGAIAIVANVPMAIALFRTSASAKRALYRMYFGQLVKIAFTVGMLFLLARTQWVMWPPLLVAYAACLAVFWWVPFASARRAVKVGG